MSQATTSFIDRNPELISGAAKGIPDSSKLLEYLGGLVRVLILFLTDRAQRSPDAFASKHVCCSC